MVIALFERHPRSGAAATASGAGLPRRVAAAIALGRVAIGAGLILAPAPALRALGFPPPSAATTVVARIAGGRDLVLGAVALHALDQEPGRLAAASLANAAVDAVDAIAFAAALGADPELRPAALRGVAAALPASLLGLWLGWRLRRDGRDARAGTAAAGGRG